MSTTTKPERFYKVEISGWDNDENFFVEQTQLEWSEHNQKKIVLRHRLASGAMVFLRLAEPAKLPASLPIAFRAGRIQAGPVQNTSLIQLEQLWPWQSEQEKLSDARTQAGTVPHGMQIFPEIEDFGKRLIH